MFALGYSTQYRPTSWVFKLLPYFLLFIATISYSIDLGEFDLGILSLPFLFLILHAVMAIDAKGPPSVDFEPQLEHCLKNLLKNFRFRLSFRRATHFVVLFQYRRDLRKKFGCASKTLTRSLLGLVISLLGNLSHAPELSKSLRKACLVFCPENIEFATIGLGQFLKSLTVIRGCQGSYITGQRTRCTTGRTNRVLMRLFSNTHPLTPSKCGYSGQIMRTNPISAEYSNPRHSPQN